MLKFHDFVRQMPPGESAILHLTRLRSVSLAVCGQPLALHGTCVIMYTQRIMGMDLGSE